jgi:predicted thioredoxin/glutaredoxin
MLLDAIQLITRSDAAVLKEKLIQQVNTEVFHFSDVEITQFLKNYLKKHEELVNEHNKLVSQPKDNN